MPRCSRPSRRPAAAAAGSPAEPCSDGIERGACASAARDQHGHRHVDRSVTAGAGEPVLSWARAAATRAHRRHAADDDARRGTSAEPPAARPSRDRHGRARDRHEEPGRRGSAALLALPDASVQESDANTQQRDDVDRVGLQPTEREIEIAIPTSWQTAVIGSQWTGRKAADVGPGTHFRIESRDTITSAPELVRMTLNMAMAHTDARLSYLGQRLVYGGHVIAIAVRPGDPRSAESSDDAGLGELRSHGAGARGRSDSVRGHGARDPATERGTILEAARSLARRAWRPGRREAGARLEVLGCCRCSPADECRSRNLRAHRARRDTRDQTRSNNAARPCPPPMHGLEAEPAAPFDATRAAACMIRTPVAAIGCPSEIPEPFTFRRSASFQRNPLSTASTWHANASLISTRSI